MVFTKHTLDSFKQATTATVRAIAEKSDITVTFSGTTCQVVGHSLYLPAVSERTLADKNQYATLRGFSDSVALRYRYHNSTLHQTYMPYQETAQHIFDSLEQLRYETIGMRKMVGVAANLEAYVANHYQTLLHNQTPPSASLPLVNALHLLTREVFTGTPPPVAVRTLVDAWRLQLSEKLKQDWYRLDSVLEDQEAFAKAIYQLLKALSLITETTTPSPTEPQHHTPEPQSNNTPHNPSPSSTPQKNNLHPYEKQSLKHIQDQNHSQKQTESSFSTVFFPTSPSSYSLEKSTQYLYRAFTYEFDEVIDAERLCDPEQLTQLRYQLDEQVKPYQNVVIKLAHRLQRRLMAQQKRQWLFDRDEGLLDCSRLTRIVLNPTTPLSFKVEHETKFHDTVISLLIDNSGSMRGQPILWAALSADILARTLERCGVNVEILGFTTNSWKGGKSREKWLQQGKPKQPGRLNDLRHILYKQASIPWRRKRKNLGLMLHDSLLKENIDGEALQWAHTRLLTRSEQRRILIVISDGAPVDDSTLCANYNGFLDQHLRDVIHAIQTRSCVELMAIGIGHDVSRYYRRAITISSAEQLGGTLIKELFEIFKKPPKYKKELLSCPPQRHHL